MCILKNNAIIKDGSDVTFYAISREVYRSAAESAHNGADINIKLVSKLSCYIQLNIPSNDPLKAINNPRAEIKGKSRAPQTAYIYRIIDGKWSKSAEELGLHYKCNLVSKGFIDPGINLAMRKFYLLM